MAASPSRFPRLFSFCFSLFFFVRRDKTFVTQRARAPRLFFHPWRPTPFFLTHTHIFAAAKAECWVLLACLLLFSSPASPHLCIYIKLASLYLDENLCPCSPFFTYRNGQAHVVVVVVVVCASPVVVFPGACVHTSIYGCFFLALVLSALERPRCDTFWGTVCVCGVLGKKKEGRKN